MKGITFYLTTTNFTGFLPRHIMPNFIVGRHDEIKGELVWQNGVVLSKQDNSAEALLQVDYHDRVLSLWVRGNKANDYFKIIYDDLKRIFNLMPELRFDEKVIVPEESRVGEPLPAGIRHAVPIRADFQDLLTLEESGATEYVCKAGRFDLWKILQIMPEKDRPAYHEKEIFETLRKIEDHLDPDPKSIKEQLGDSIELKLGIFGVSVDVKTAIKAMSEFCKKKWGGPPKRS
ncbi:MAG: hypothetical protein ACTFAK_08515 [Candidatus Electronema sp. VV]